MTMVRGLGEDNAIAFLSLMVEKLNNSIAVGNKMNDEDVMECAVVLSAEYGILKVEQLAQFCHFVKTGKMGVFVRFGQAEFFEALNRYTSDTDEQMVQDYISNKEIDDERPKRGNAHKIGTILTQEDLKKLEDGNKGSS